jgi:hypothetical protein
MTRSEFICKNCLCRIDADPSDKAKDLCILPPDWKPTTPEHYCGSGKWRTIVIHPKSGEKLEMILNWGEWE